MNLEGPVSDDLNLPNVKTLRHVVVDGQHAYEAQSIDPVGVPCCLLFEAEKRPNGFKHWQYLDTTRDGQMAIIHFRRRRWKCEACGRSVYEKLDWIANRHGMTERCAEWTFRQAIRRSFSQVAGELGVHHQLVTKVFTRKAIPEVRAMRLETPRVLGMDEKHLFGGMRCVFGNVEQRTIFWMLKQRDRTHLVPFFKKMKDKDRVQVVTIDMYRPYLNILAEYLPNATVVIDKFHILRYATMALDTARAAIRKGGQPRGERIRLMNQRWTLLKRRHSWNERDEKRFKDIVARYPHLGEVFDLKEAVHEIFDSHISRDEAIRQYLAWRQSIPDKHRRYFKAFTTAMTNWGQYIFNYFDHRYTNAYVERLNGVIDDANRIGRGYRFATLFLKMMLSHGRSQDKRPKINRSRDLLEGVTYRFEGMQDVIEEALRPYLEDDADVSHGAVLSTFSDALREGSFP